MTSGYSLFGKYEKKIESNLFLGVSLAEDRDQLNV